MIGITPEILECYKTEFSCQYNKLAEKYTDYLFIGEENCSDKKLLELVTTNALLDSLCLLNINAELVESCITGVFEDVSDNIVFNDVSLPSAFVDSKTALNALENNKVYKINLAFEFDAYGADVTLANNFDFIFSLSRTVNSLPDPVNSIIINGQSSGLGFLNSDINSNEPYEIKLEINNCKKTVKWSVVNDSNILATGIVPFFNTNTYAKDINYTYYTNSETQGELTLAERANTSSNYKYTLECFSEEDFNTLIETIKLKLEGCSC